MLEELLQELALVHAETFFINPPDTTHLVYGEEIDAYGSDFDNELQRHSITMDLIERESVDDPAAHQRLQAALNSRGWPWKKSVRIFYEDIRLYVTTYTFDFLDRRN